MKRSNIWFASILIASALFLSGARKVVANGPNQRNKTNNQPQQNNESSSPIFGAVAEHQPTSHTTRESGQAETYNYYGNFNYVPNQSLTRDTGIPWDEIGNVATVIATIAVAVFTCALWVTSRRQWKIANDTLLLQFRPRLIVRNVVTKGISITANVTDAPFLGGYPVSGQFYIANVGGSDAKITEIGCWVHWLQRGLPMARPYEGENGNTSPFSQCLKPGESTACPFESDRILEPHLGDAVRAGQNGWGLYIMGWVEYTDKLGVQRRTAFCRKWDPNSSRFTIMDDPDYEHIE